DSVVAYTSDTIKPMQLEHDATSGKYIMRVDPSLMRDSDCLRYIFLRLIQGFSGTSVSAKDWNMEYGTACHKAFQIRYGRGASLEEQLQVATAHYSQPEIIVPESDFRTVGHLVSTLVAYDSY